MKTQIPQRRAARRPVKPSAKAASSKQRPGIKGRLKSHRKASLAAGPRKRSRGVDLAEQSFSTADSPKPQASVRPENPKQHPTPTAKNPPAGKATDTLSAETTPPIQSQPSGQPIAEKEGETNLAASQQGFGAPYGYFREGEAYPDPFPYEPPTDAEAAALRLTPAQRTALEKITLGNQLSVAARAAGVTRMTLYRWLHQDPNFQAAYNVWQMDAIVNSRARILAITNTATTTLEFAVQTDPRMALALLRCVGIMQPVHQVPTEPEECKREIDRLERQARATTTGAMQTSVAETPGAKTPADQSAVVDIGRTTADQSKESATKDDVSVDQRVAVQTDQNEADRSQSAPLQSAHSQSPGLASPSQQPIAPPSLPATVIPPQSTSTKAISLPTIDERINGRIEAPAAANAPLAPEERVAGHTNPESEGAAQIPQDVTFCNIAPLGHGLDGAGKVEVLCRSDLP